jgi:hypothetical protein
MVAFDALVEEGDLGALEVGWLRAD